MSVGTRVVASMALLSLLAAGCFDAVEQDDATARVRGAGGNGGPQDLVIPADWAELAIPMGDEHDHKDATHHLNLSTSNFELLGYDPLISDYYGKTPGDHFCGDAKEKDGRRLSVVQSWGSDVAFVLADVTDPRQPRKLGELVMANTQVYDVALTPDFNYVVLSTSPFDSGPDTVPPPLSAQWGSWRDACTGTTSPVMGPEAGLPYSSGVVLVDIRNPLNPVVADFRQLPIIGSHSVRANEAGGQTIITVSVDNAVSTVSYYTFFEAQETPAGPKLMLLSAYNYVPEGPEDSNPYTGIHMDGLVSDHPITGQRLAFLAPRQLGLILVDLDDPSSPEFIARWHDFPFTAHSVLPMKEAWDGRHYTIIGEECGGPTRGNPSCLIAIIDTTDPAHPEFVSAWTLPVPVQWTEGLEFSMHYFDVVNRTLFVSTYHGGLWAVDLSTSDAIETMPSTGVFIPALESPAAFDRPPRSAAGETLFGTIAGTSLADRPTILDLNAMSDGSLVVWDGQSGLYTVRFDASNPAPSPEPWDIQGIT